MIEKAEPLPTHAGAVVYRDDLSAPEFLLVQASKSHGEWVLPKGHIEPGEVASSAALREVLEEAGVKAELIDGDPRLGLSSYQAGSEAVRVMFFLSRCVSEAPSRENRAKSWLPADQAEAALTHEESRSILRCAKSKLFELLSGVGPLGRTELN